METVQPYKRLHANLASLIANTLPGERLPSEPELAQKMGVSRATLREAMRSFEGQGLIRRKQGVGTFVVGHTQVIDSGLEKLESIETLAKRIGLEVSMGDLQVREVPADEDMAAGLGCAPGEPVIQVLRVIHAENRPVAFLVDSLPRIMIDPAVLGEGFTGSVLDLLLTRGEQALVQSRTEIRAVAAPADVARSLQIQRGDVLLLFIAHLYSAEGKIVDYSYSYFLPGYFRFHVVRQVGVPVVQRATA